MVTAKMDVITPALLAWTHNKRVLIFGGQGERPDAKKAIQAGLHFASLEWVVTERGTERESTKVADNMRPGRYDLVILLIRFMGHHAMEIARAAKAVQIPVVMITGGYNVQSIALAIVQQLREARQRTVVKAPIVEKAPFVAPEVLTAERRAEAMQWLHGNSSATYPEFKNVFPERYFETSWFQAQKRHLGHTQQPTIVQSTSPTEKEMPMAIKQPIDDNMKVRAYLEKLSRAELQAITYKRYVATTGHNCSASLFSSLKHRLMHPKKGAAAAAPIGKPAAAFSGTLIQVVARIDLSSYEGLPVPKAKDLILDLMKQVHARGGEATLIMLAEPPALEVRLPT